MPSLTSCYFCGDAVGASLDEYDLPGAAPADRQVSVTLCAGCYGKLSELLGELQLPGDSTSSVDAATVDAGGSTALDPVAGEREPIFAEDEGALLDEDLPVDEEAEGPFAADQDPSSSDVAAEEPAADGTGRSDDGENDAGGDSEPAEPEGGHATADEPTDESSADGDDERAAPTVEARTDGSEAPAQNASAEASDGTSEASDGSSEDRTDQRGSDGPLADISPRTYNRVVRLLQNREFPVDRTDFEALATSAYELEHPECAAALDAAIEKGLLEERDGALHRPE